MEISKLIPKALSTLAHPTQAEPINTDRASKWMLSEKFGWSFVGNETAQERTALTEAMTESVRWLSAFIEGLEPYWLVLIGPSGTGKSMIAERLARFVAKNGDRVFDQTEKRRNEAAIYSYAQEGSTFAPWRLMVPHSPDNQGRFERAKTDWFKAIDDLKPQTGAEVEIDGVTGIKPKFFEANAAGDLLDARLRHWTIITSNLTRSQLAMFWDARIASRLLRDYNIIVDLSDVSDFGLRKERWLKSKK